MMVLAVRRFTVPWRVSSLHRGASGRRLFGTDRQRRNSALRDPVKVNVRHNLVSTNLVANTAVMRVSRSILTMSRRNPHWAIARFHAETPRHRHTRIPGFTVCSELPRSGGEHEVALPVSTIPAWRNQTHPEEHEPQPYRFRPSSARRNPSINKRCKPDFQNVRRRLVSDCPGKPPCDTPDSEARTQTNQQPHDPLPPM